MHTVKMNNGMWHFVYEIKDQKSWKFSADQRLGVGDPADESKGVEN